MKNTVTFLILIFLFGSCHLMTPKDNKRESETRIVREYYPNKILKTEITLNKNNAREGITKNYDPQGKLKSEISYKNNKKNGLSKDYYPSGKIHASVSYKDGIKNGDETWFYENGKPFRLSPYMNGVIGGIQKWYYKNGALMGEVPYQNGKPGIGLKEYSETGKPITNYPQIVVREKDQIRMANKFILTISLSNNSKNVKFYIDSLSQGKYLRRYMNDIPVTSGVATQVYNVPPGFVTMQKLNIIAEYKTPRGLPCILQKSYNLALQH